MKTYTVNIKYMVNGEKLVNIVMDDVYNIHTYSTRITFFRKSTGDTEFNYNSEHIEDLTITLNK